MKFKVSTVEEASIDTVVIIDIEQNSIEGLGIILIGHMHIMVN